MPRLKHVVELDYVPTFRSQKVAGMFDVAVTKKLRREWDINLPIEKKKWQVGLIVGQSGAGKSVLSNALWPGKVHQGFQWTRKCFLDDFPKAMDTKLITETLSKVGFSSPPQWLLPYGALSTGQKFRAELARCLLEYESLFVFDEFTSVVDRQIAQVGSFAFQKAIRRSGKQFVAVTCHYDVEPWLQPDWVFDVTLNSFRWGSVQRPKIELEICRVHHSAWDLFKEHHYLTGAINKSAFCFVGLIDGRPVVFDAWLPFVGRLKHGMKAMRGHRTVCLPDFQGLGLGNTLFTTLASMWAGLGYRAFSATTHPAEINKRVASGIWRCTGQGRTSVEGVRNDGKKIVKTRAFNRLTARFEYTGPRMDRDEARALICR
jgi:hypothetical protein